MLCRPQHYREPKDFLHGIKQYIYESLRASGVVLWIYAPLRRFLFKLQAQRAFFFLNIIQKELANKIDTIYHQKNLNEKSN